jgi:hypothetical protein
VTTGLSISNRRWLLPLAVWFVLWGWVALASVDKRDQAERAWFDADQRRDWPAAEHNRLEASSARRWMAIAAGAGFGLPFLWLLGLEARRLVSARHSRQD